MTESITTSLMIDLQRSAIPELDHTTRAGDVTPTVSGLIMHHYISCLVTKALLRRQGSADRRQKC